MPPAPSKLGLDCKLYRNTGTYATPTWTEITIAKNVALDVQMDEADVTSRGSLGWAEVQAALNKAELTVGLVLDQADAQYVALETAYFARTAVEIACLSGASATTGSRGLRASMAILAFPRSEDLADACEIAMKMKPTRNANAPPAWMIVP